MAKISADIKTFLEAPHIGFIATSGPEGINVTPKGSLGYLDEEHLVYADRRSIKTMKNLSQNKQVSVIIMNNEHNNAYQFKGTAELLDKGPLVDKYNNDPMAIERKLPPVKCVVKIKVDKVYHQAGPGYGAQIA